jgi:hypothetical protein
MIDGLKEAFKAAISESAHDTLAWIGANISHFLLSISYSLALYGGGILIILYVAGYRKGLRYCGILFVSHILIRYLLG